MMPNLIGQRKITIKASQVAQAIKRARRLFGDDWQAECLEIALLPAINKRWRAVNRPFHADLTLTRHIGKTPLDIKREDYQKTNWLTVAGYELGYGGATTSYCWNRARADYWGHSPGTAWDGVRRETCHSFIYTLLAIYRHALEGREPSWREWDNLLDYRINFVNDL